jgi:hypothetical protein
MRTILAAFVAQNVNDWTDAFLAHNSGTYNNEYFVVDGKLLNLDKRVNENLVKSVLQLPGPWRFEEDLTDELYREGFIASFNVPKNQEAAKIMQWDLAVANAGAFGCDYLKCPRYLISKRESPRLTDWDAFKKFMRYSGYKRDGYSKWDGVPYHSYCISSRGDTDDDVSLRIPHGGLNAKVCKASEVRTRMRIYGVNTPSYEDNPEQNWPLDWNKPPFINMSHDGLPDVWTFTSWVGEDNQGFDFCGSFVKKADCTAVNFCGWCGGSEKCIPGDKDGPFFNEECGSGWTALGTKIDVGLIVGLSVGGVALLAVIVVVIVVLWRRKQHD